jgi:hypothetical protein
VIISGVMMVYLYLFEAKSIQSYLFKSGKLIDVIAASERLDLLIDDVPNSTLNKVLNTAKLSSDLLDEKDSTADIHFIRCKGGAFYCYSTIKSSLIKLRSIWTLTLQQMFPSLDFVDALITDNSLQKALTIGHGALAADRNTPKIKFPLASTIHNRYARTGQAAVPLSIMAKRAEKGDENLDLDTDLHRQAYQNFSLRESAALQDKFTPRSLVHDDNESRRIYYPINLEEDFQYSAILTNKRSEKEAIKDIALIHIDGNGLGLLLRALQNALKDKNDQEYCRVFRQFSQALTSATQLAAQEATQWLYNNAVYQLDGSDKKYLPMRPLVLGGDDVTLLCRADLALEYSKRFCSAFKCESETALKGLHKKHQLAKKEVKPYLTASGGILYHKANHPFTHSHHLVEDLCDKAKKLTKSIDEKTGPAALAFYRLSNSVSSDIDSLCKQTQQFDVQDKENSQIINLGINAYLVENEGSPINFDNLQNCINACSSHGVSMNKWRQITTELALGNKIEADRLYERAMEISEDKLACKAQIAAMQKIAGDGFKQWYWLHDSREGLQTIISDMLVIDHFSPVLHQNQLPQDSTPQYVGKEQINAG